MFCVVPGECCLLCWREWICANLSESKNMGLWIMMNLLLPMSIFFWEKVKVPKPSTVTPCFGAKEREKLYTWTFSTVMNKGITYDPC